jgi:fluoride ion exporter CrcB/FEX
MAKVVGCLVGAVGAIMTVSAVLTLVFVVLGSGAWDAIPRSAMNLVIGLVACCAGFVIWRGKPKKEE